MLLKKGGTRLYFIGSNATQLAVRPSIDRLTGSLKNIPFEAANYATEKQILKRLKDRTELKESPVFVGLLAPNMPTGVFMNWATLTGFHDTDREHLLQLLAGSLYAGGNKQSVFAKSTGAGMSYSTGIGINPFAARLSYYAERTPELPQTLRFVIDEVKKAPQDNNIKDYVLALQFFVRSSADYESRGTAIATDLADGYTPAVVKQFRQALLRLRNDPNLINEIYQRKDIVYSRILPGYNGSVKGTGGQFMVIGNERQMAAYEAYLKSVEGKETELYRLFPRDFWPVNE
jgi:hypothetical protein